MELLHGKQIKIRMTMRKRWTRVSHQLLKSYLAASTEVFIVKCIWNFTFCMSRWRVWRGWQVSCCRSFLIL